MALALSTLLTELGHATGTLRRSGTTTATGSTLTAVDSGLIGPAGYDDALKDMWLLGTSGTYGTLALRRLINNGSSTAYTAATGTMTWLDALAGNFGSGVTYQLYTIDPQYLVDALNDARRLCQKYLWREIVDIGHVTGSRIFNGGFVHWSSAAVPLGWRNNSTTMSRVSAPLTGNSIQLTGAAGSIDTYTQPFLPIRESLTDLESTNTISLYADVITSTASHARIRILVGTSYYSDYHAGDNIWAQLKLENKSVDKGAGARFALHIEGNNTAQFTNVYTKGGPQVYQYAVPSTYMPGSFQIGIADSSDLTQMGGAGLYYRPTTNWRFVRDVMMLDEVEAATVTGLVQFDSPPPNGHRMQWLGRGFLSSVALLTDEMEVDNDTSFYLYAWAKWSLFNRLAGERRHDPQLYDDYMKAADRALAEVEGYERRGQHITPRPKQAKLVAEFG